MTSQQKKTNKVNELEHFSEELEKYLDYVYLHKKGGLTKKQATEALELRKALLEYVGRFKGLITELTGKDKITLMRTRKGLPVEEISTDMWLEALTIPYRPVTGDTLLYCIDVTRMAVGRFKSDIEQGIRDEQGNQIKKPVKKTEQKYSTKALVQLFDSMQFHPKIVQASRKLFEDGHYRDAILRAFIEVNSFVKAKTGLELDGKALMSRVFRVENPVIKLNELKTQSEKDEQEGFMFLFMGAMVGIRNPKAHDNIIQRNPLRTLEYLALASMLMRRAE
jgi:uncharacterized protein (TIGR02391 family)